ncbi:hypothetical protein [Kitasatospora sp. NPDC093102]|uniref:hypothetical protein n=1 Tax=Kitasatospora sp. NPDC093102 TaxID=3155069 RepID=UPI00343CF137
MDGLERCRPCGALLRRRFALESTTLVWIVVGIVVLAAAAISARAAALGGLGMTP